MADKVFNSPINTSRYKNFYSFPRAQRFQKQSSQLCTFYLPTKNAATQKAPSFGFGERHSMVLSNIQEPAKYKAKDFFVTNLEKRKGFSFAYSKKNHVFSDTMKLLSPGPSYYQAKIEQHNQISYTIGVRRQPKTKPSVLVRLKQKTGPGYYELENTINSYGNYSLSNRKNSCCSKINQSNRFQTNQLTDVGPGKYNEDKQEINKLGFYFNSKHPSSRVRSFAKSARKSQLAKQSETPGPGEQYLLIN